MEIYDRGWRLKAVILLANAFSSLFSNKNTYRLSFILC